MAHAEKRDGKLTGHWYGEVDLRHKGGQRYRQRFETKREAEGFEAYVKATGEAPPWTAGTAGSGLTFAQVAQEAKDAGGPHGAWKGERDPSVLQRIDFLMGTTLGRLPIEGVSTASLMALVSDLEKRPGKAQGAKMSPGTINRYLTAASAVLAFAVAANHRTDVPKVPWRKEQKQSRFWWLTEAQELNVCAALEAKGLTREAASVRVLTRTGLRWGEFESLEPAQVEDTWVRLWATKTDTPRSVPITPELARELRAMVQAKALPNYYTFRGQFKDACVSCGYAKELTLHCLRHTTATRLVQANVALPKVQRFMGHKSINTTMRYVHVHDDDLAEAAKNLHHRSGEDLEKGAVLKFGVK